MCLCVQSSVSGVSILSFILGEGWGVLVQLGGPAEIHGQGLGFYRVYGVPGPHQHLCPPCELFFIFVYLKPKRKLNISFLLRFLGEYRHYSQLKPKSAKAKPGSSSSGIVTRVRTSTLSRLGIVSEVSAPSALSHGTLAGPA